MNLINTISSTPYLADAAYEVAGCVQRPLNWLRHLTSANSDYKVTNIICAVTSKCNAACTFCMYPKTKLARGVMTMATFERVLLLLGKLQLRHLDFTPVVGDVCEDLTFNDKLGMAHSFGLTTSFTTNAIGLNKIEIEQLSLVNKICVSLPSFNAEDYKRMYGVNRLDEVKANIKELLLIAAYSPKLHVHFYFRNSLPPRVILADPWFKSHIKPMLSDKVTMSFTHSWDNWGGGITQDHLPVKRMKLRTGYNYSTPCSSLRGWMVLWDGAVRACGCRFLKTDHDDLVIGHVNDSVYKLLANAITLEHRFRIKNRPETCKNCAMYKPIP